MNRKAFGAAALALSLALTGCNIASTQTGSSAVVEEVSSVETPMTATLPIPGIDAKNYPAIDGSTANHPLIRRVYSEICGISMEEAETLVNLDLGSTGSIWQRAAYSDDSHGLYVLYEPPEEVKAELGKQLEQFEIIPIGRDALVFLANAQNPVESLTVTQLQEIYQGKLTDWSEVGGAKGPIKPFQRNADSGSQTLFLKLLMSGLAPMTPPTELVQMTMGGLIDGVAAFDGAGGAIGFSVYYYASLMHQNPDLKILSVDSVAPSSASITDQSYPLTNDFYLVMRADEPQDSPVRLLRNWLLGENGKRLLEEEGYVWVEEHTPVSMNAAG